ncbi:MAG: hypothetical protein GX868_00335, partial [Actinobacteria bacterium]|nr:hypothetical protein [Actinomycetota bacterium]
MAEHIGDLESGDADTADGGAVQRTNATAASGASAVVMTMGCLAIAIVAAGIAAATSGWTSVSDVALIELRVRDVPAHLPLVGVYSRYGWNHPGPAAFYGLAPFYRLFGGASVGLLVGALFFQFGGVIASLAAVRRIGETAAIAVAGGAIAAFLGMPPEALRSPWNPYVSLGGVVALVAFGWAFAERRRSGALALFAVASVMTQTHVVSAPIAAAVVVAAVALSWSSRGQDRPVSWPWIGGGVALAALVWLAPIVQQFTGSPGNLGEVLSAGSGDDPAVGFGAALQAFTGAFAVVPSSLDRGNVIGFGDPLAWHVPVWLAVVAAGGVAAWSTGRPGRSRRAEKAVLAENAGRAEKAALPENAERAETVRVARVGGAGPISLERVPHDRVSHDPVAHDPVALDPVSHERVSLVRGWLIAAAATLGSIISIAMVTGTAFGYLRIGLRVSSLLWIAISIAALTAALWPRLARPVLGIGVVAAALVLAVVATVSGNPDAGAGEGTEALARAADSVRREVGVPRSEPVEISHSVDFGASLYGPALMVELERRGWNVQS